MQSIVSLDHYGVIEITDAELLATVSAGSPASAEDDSVKNGYCVNNGCSVDVNQTCNGSNSDCVGVVNAACGANIVCTL